MTMAIERIYVVQWKRGHDGWHTYAPDGEVAAYATASDAERRRGWLAERDTRTTFRVVGFARDGGVSDG